MLIVQVLVMNYLLVEEQMMGKTEVVKNNLVLEVVEHILVFVVHILVAVEDNQVMDHHILVAEEDKQVVLDVKDNWVVLEVEEDIQVVLEVGEDIQVVPEAVEDIQGNQAEVVGCRLASFQVHCFDKAHLG